jgi:TRAP-type C4-dicarboxylate transport system permease small subunit
MQLYFSLMDKLHRACLFLAGLALVTITLAIPYGVFTRYVLKSAASWPEPLSVILMISISFLSAIICYREHLHISVGLLPNALQGFNKKLLGIFIELSMLFVSLFLLYFGYKLCLATLNQTIAEFPKVPVGITYLPVPICGLITALFGIERMMKANYFPPEPELADILSTE